MGFRFRKSISILPGVRVNLSNGIPSLTVGPRGASVSFSRRGTYANLGVPGTGLSYRTRLDRSARSRSGGSNRTDPALRHSLEEEVLALMSAVHAITNIHELTPDPSWGTTLAELESLYLRNRMAPFQRPAPIRPVKPENQEMPAQPEENEGVGFLGKLFESESARTARHAENLLRWEQEIADITRENALQLQRYQQQRAAWAEQYANWQHEANEHAIKLKASQVDTAQQFLSDSAWFESVLSEVLSQTEWPRETLVEFEVKPEQSVVMLDVDLPEIEDMPDKIYSVNARGTEIIEKAMSQKAQRDNYARHVHGCLMRLAGIAFYALPFDTVIISGFTQRICKRTGYLEDQYIISCRCDRLGIENLNFMGIQNVDPVEALNSHMMIRKMSSTFIFQPIEPLTSNAGFN